MQPAQVNYCQPEGIDGLELLHCPDVGYRFAPHFHASYCIWLNSSGGEFYRHRGNSDILQPDSFGIIAPGEVHENRACENQRRNLLTFYLTPERLEQVAAEITGRPGPAAFRTAFYRDRQAQLGLIRLHRILSGDASQLEKQSAFVELLALLLQRYAVTGSLSNTTHTDPPRVAKLIELFHAQLAEEFSLQQLAEQLDCTPYHLIRSFKQAVGLSPHAYRVQLRLEKARQLIAQGQPLVDCALATGFSDQSHLTRQFKQKFGVPPGDYRRQICG